MKKILLITMCVAMCIYFLPINARAGTVYFTGSDFAPALGQKSFSSTYNEVEFALEAGVFPIGEAALWWDDEDGIGVQFSYEQDEIEGPEYLKLSFTETILLESVYISDLFNEWGYLESGYYRTDGDGPWVEFMALAGQLLGSSNGEIALRINETINSIVFTAPGLLQNGEHHEYALQGFTTGTPAPLPSALLLLGSGVLGLVCIRTTSKA